MSNILTQASHQWASRPTDQRFLSLIALNDHCVNVRRTSIGRTLSNRMLEAMPLEDDNRGLVISGPNGVPVTVSHWAFGQLAQRAGAPAGYLRDLPAPLAADCINYGLRYSRDVEEIGVLLRKSDATPHLSAVTGPNYGRIWNSTITQALVDRFGDGVTGEFRVPGEFGVQVEVTRDNTTLYASDQDMFVFLADEQNKIEIPGRRDGKPGQMSRGFFIWNSEVGSQSFGIATFLFDYTCSNRIVWGAEQYKEIRLRHTAGAPDRWLEEIVPALEAYRHSSTDGIVTLIEKAKEARIDDLDSFLKKRFTNKQATAIKAAHMSDEQRPIETIWDATTGVTAYARSIQYQNERVDLEREGGKILQLVA